MNQQDKNVNTGIIYLPLPEPQLQLVKPEQSFDSEEKIKQDFSIRYPYLNKEELNEIFNHIERTNANRYKINYENLYQNLLQSILNNFHINEEILQMKHSIKYQNEILPIFIYNHQLAKREKYILYHIITKTWQIFDQSIQNEIHLEYQIEQIQNEHQHLIHMKIKQEQYQTFYLQLHEIQNDITHLKREIQQLQDYKHQLQNEIYERKSNCSHNIIQIDYLKSTILRYHTNQLNNLQLERHSLITQIELIKYNLFEQIQEYDYIVNNYRQSLNNIRLTITELEQELKEQTDKELIHLEITNFFQRQTISDDTQHLIIILENKIQEKQLLNIQLQKNIENFQDNIFKQKQLVIKKTKDYQTMDQIDQQLNYHIHIYRELYLQLKIERRTIERQLTIKLKQYTTDDRFNHTLNQQCDSLLARKKVEQIRINTLTEQLESLIDENIRLKNSFEQISNQYNKINPKNLFDLREKILQLKEIHQNSIQQKDLDLSEKNHHQNLNEQYQRKTNRISIRINQILKRIKQNYIDFKENSKHIQILEYKLNEEQRYYHQEKYLVKNMRNRSESYRTKQDFMQTQIQVVSDHIQNSQYRLKTFTEQLFICHNDLTEQQIFRNKLQEFHSVLKEQDEINRKRFSIIYNQSMTLQNQYKISQKSLERINEDLRKYFNVRLILGRMVVRRVNLCQLLYKKLARFDEYIHQRRENIQRICKCINSLKIQIHRIRNENKKFLQRKDKHQLETLKIHMDKMLDHSHQKQRFLTKQIFQRHFHRKPSLDRLPTEEFSYLQTKYYSLKNRLIKIILRAIICNFLFLSIEQDFSNHLQFYISKTNRKYSINFNSLRTNLYQLICQLKAKTAEKNMLIDYQYYFQLIHTDTIQQLTHQSFCFSLN